MSVVTLADYESKNLGLQETLGQNKGPNLTKWGKEVLGGGWTGAPISWCGIFQFAMLMEFNSLTRKDLIAALGMPGLFPESADSWLQIGTKAGLIIPQCEDMCIAVWMKQNPDGSYSKTDAHHVVLVTSKYTPRNGTSFQTIEGNTTPVGEGLASRNGNGSYAKTRVWHPGAWVFIKIAKQSLYIHEVANA